MSHHRTGLGRLVAVTVATSSVFAGIALTAVPAYAASVPTITSLSVKVGSEAGGTNVVVTGTGFSSVDESTAANVKFGSANAAKFMVVSDTQLVARTAAGTGAADTGLVDLIITNTTGPSVASTNSKFAYRAPLTANLGSATKLNAAGGTSLTVPVTGYTFGTSGNFSKEKVTATVGGKAAVVSYGSSSTVILTLPAGTPSSTASTIALFHDGIAGTNDTTYGKYAAVITSLSPSSGVVGGGTSVVITGIGLLNGGTFKFGGVAAASCGTPTATTVTCVTPASAGSAIGAVSVNFVPANSVAFGTTSGAAFTYSDVS